MPIEISIPPLSWSSDDAVWVDLWPTGPTGFEYQFEANPNGSHNESSSENTAFAPHWDSRGAVTADGYTVTPPILVPSTATSVTVSQTGLVTATIPGQTAPQTVGQLTIANFVNAAGLQALGNNLFQQTTASGQPQVGVPGDTAFGVIQQGYLEASNVDPVSEITNLIAAQRAYEMNSKVIQAADQMSGTISNMRN